MSLVLVTGISGFVGSHVADQLVKAGYNVRGTARGPKINALAEFLRINYPTQLELVQVDDIATTDLTEALTGVDAVIHVASPLPSPAMSPRTVLDIAIGGALNVLRQAVKMNVKKIVVTSSWGATVDSSLKQAFSGKTFTEQDWGDVTEEEVITGSHDPLWVYIASKTLAERAVWTYAEENPSLDVATINPPFIFGPFASGFPVPSVDALSTNVMVYALLSGRVPPHLPPLFCDVRDVARAHVAALLLPPQTPIHNKRFLISGGFMLWKEATNYLANTRPYLKARLPNLDQFVDFPGPLSTINTSRAERTLGLKTYIDWEDTLNDTINVLLAAEIIWNSRKTVQKVLAKV